ncbi:MAG TPA: hypothetical protein VMF61_11620 [Candidatus Acidoferrales bacterium]|nr:hypothetical protein [Candidatus Acidoferrales bacterium]
MLALFFAFLTTLVSHTFGPVAHTTAHPLDSSGGGLTANQVDR